MARRQIFLPRPHPGQQRVIDNAKRFNVLGMGRRTGKSVLGIDRAVGPVLNGDPVGWFSPTYKMLEPMWQEALKVLTPVASQVSVQNKMIRCETGGVLDMWSLDDPNAARGRKYKRIVVDEAAMVKSLQVAWQEVLRPTLADLRGDAWFMSTPKGLNYFRVLASWGESVEAKYADWAYFHAPTSDNPYIHPEEIEAMRLSMPSRVFAQEVLAQFLDTEGAVFRGVMEAAAGWTEDLDPKQGHEYAIGIDWGKINDYTVIVVVDNTDSKVATFHRSNQVGYSTQIEHIRSYVERFHPTVIMPEMNSIGIPLIERMRDEFDWPIVPFTTTNASKQFIIDQLSLAIETQAFQIPNDDTFIGELLSFECERLQNGMLRYSAPDGMHDDCVMALALAWQAINSTPAWFSFMKAAEESDAAKRPKLPPPANEPAEPEEQWPWSLDSDGEAAG